MNIRNKFGVGKTTGAIGIEIEAEGRNLLVRTEEWDVVGDGSLEDGVEYVLREPTSLKGARSALVSLQEALAGRGAVLKQSARTSVHVHVNVQSLSMKEMYTFVTAYLVLEGVLTRFCGKDREGNLFCLRAGDAEYRVASLANAVRTKDIDYLLDDDHRYSAINTCSLGRFGSLEFRAMRGSADFNTIHNWAAMLLLLRNKSRLFDSPQDIIKVFSLSGGGEAFLRKLVGKRASLLIEVCPDLDELLFNGMRQAQDVAYAIPSWENY